MSTETVKCELHSIIVDRSKANERCKIRSIGNEKSPD